MIFRIILFLILIPNLSWSQDKQKIQDTPDDSLEVIDDEIDQKSEDRPEDVRPEIDKLTEEYSYTPPNISKKLNLKMVLERGLRANTQERVRQLSKKILDLGFDGTWDEFWLPNVSLNVSSDDHKLANLGRGPGPRHSTESHSYTNTPDGTISLTVEDYVLFNWGRDYLNYLNSKANYKKGVRNITESRRFLKHQLITEYFRLGKIKVFEKTHKSQLRHASFIYRLAREKAALKKISKQEYYEARNLYLDRQNDYDDARQSVAIQDEVMANLLNDGLQTTYKMAESLQFKKLRIQKDESINIAMRNNPDVLDDKIVLQNSQRTLQRDLKDNLPLPTFKIDFGGFYRDFDRNQASSSWRTGTGGNTWDLVATISASWNIIGADGFLNKRKIETSRIRKKQAELKLYDSKREIQVKVRQLYRSIKYFENKYKIAKIRLDNSQKVFDSTLDNYMSSKTTFDDLREALRLLRDSEIELQQTKFSHLSYKVILANTIGLEDFPGENFENLAKKEYR